MARFNTLTITDISAFKVISKCVSQFHKGVRMGLLETAPEIVKEVQRGILSPPKTGRLYMIFGKLHQASAPGEYPAELTGTLREGVQATVKGHSELTVGDTVSYGKRLEEGDATLQPRPHLQPGAISKAQFMGQAIGRGIKRTLKP